MGIYLIAIILIYAIANYFKPFEKINNLNSLYGEVKILVIDNQEFRDLNKNGVLDKYEDHRLAGDIRSDDLLSKMTIDEKIGQLFMVRISSASGQKSFDKTEENISQNHIGGLIFSKGSPSISNRWINALQKKSKLPLLTGMDAEWGASMRYDSIKKFPWNMTLGAIQDLSLIHI